MIIVDERLIIRPANSDKLNAQDECLTRLQLKAEKIGYHISIEELGVSRLITTYKD